MKGTGTELDPFIIENETDLGSLVGQNGLNAQDEPEWYECLPNHEYNLGGNDDQGAFWNNGEGWGVIGSSGSDWEGKFNGRGAKIVGLYINKISVSNQGLFGTVQETGHVHDIYVEGNITVDGGFHHGLIAGRSQRGGIVERYECYGEINGGQNVGGAIGFTDTDINGVGTVRDGISDVLVRASRYAGGHVGRANSADDILDNLIGLGQARDMMGTLVTGDGPDYGDDATDEGGIVGRAGGSGVVRNSFYNSAVNTSGRTSSATGKILSQLRNIVTYNDTATDGLTTAWSIVLKSNHDGELGTAIWYIDDGNDTPKLYFSLDALPSGNFKINGVNKSGAMVVLIQADNKEFLNMTNLAILTTDVNGDWEYTGESYDSAKELGVLIDYEEAGDRWSRFKWRE